MKIVTVLPITKSPGGDELTYFTSLPVEVGKLVGMPIGKRTEHGIVMAVADVGDIKSEIKDADFNLRKIQSVHGKAFFSKSFLIACEKSAKYFLGSTGQVVSALVPAVFMRNCEKIIELNEDAVEYTENLNKNNQKLIIQDADEDRFSFYRSLIREGFAQKKSIFVCLPTIADINYFSEKLTKGIEDYSYIFHSEISEKEILKRYAKLKNENHPYIIISTGQYFHLITNNISTIILDCENSDEYKLFSRPHIDVRVFAELFSGEAKIKLILGDRLLRPETIARLKNGEFSDALPPSFRLTKPDKVKLVDMNKMPVDEKNSILDTDFIFSTESKEMITKQILKGDNVFLFTLRKGLAPVTVCGHCGNTLKCEKCGHLFALYNLKKADGEPARLFICNFCKEKKPSDTSCEKCGSWNMQTLGIGTDLVTEKVKEIFNLPDENIFQIDKTVAKTSVQARKIAENFYKTKGSIMVGTEMALRYLKQPIQNSVILSLDTLFGVPSFASGNQMLCLVSDMLSITEKNFIAQTRNSDSLVWECLRGGSAMRFYDEELKERKIFNYPPFSTLIKITHAGKKDQANEARQKLTDLFKDYNPDLVNGFMNISGGLYTTKLIMKIKRSDWSLPEIHPSGSLSPTLSQKLRSLTPNFDINIEPVEIIR